MHRTGVLVVAAAIGACGDSRSAPTDAAVDSTRVDGAVVDAVADAAIDASVDAPPTGPTEEAKLVGAGTNNNDYFGTSVALSDDASRALIGALGDNSARVFVRTGTAWVEETSLTALVPGPNDYFGAAVALNADASRALVGASLDNTPDGASAGSAQVYVRTGTTWAAEATLRASDGAPNEYFGGAVALSADGDRALVGASSDGVTSASSEGSGRVFRRSGTTWVEEAVLRAVGAVPFDHFGKAVALSADGTRALVGAPDADTANGAEAGSVRVFLRTGTTWVEETALVASGAAAGEGFGESVALSSDGSRAIVGAKQGKTRVFLRTGTTWVEEAAFVSPWQGFGIAVALSSDASRALVGASLAQPGSVVGGTVLVYERSGTTWTETAPLVALGQWPLAYFGGSVALSWDGRRALVGAAGDNTTGSARVVVFP